MPQFGQTRFVGSVVPHIGHSLTSWSETPPKEVILIGAGLGGAAGAADGGVGGGGGGVRVGGGAGGGAGALAGAVGAAGGGGGLGRIAAGGSLDGVEVAKRGSSIVNAGRSPSGSRFGWRDAAGALSGAEGAGDGAAAGADEAAGAEGAGVGVGGLTALLPFPDGGRGSRPGISVVGCGPFQTTRQERQVRPLFSSTPHQAQ